MKNYQERITQAVAEVVTLKGTIECFWSDRWENDRRNWERSGYPTIIIVRNAEGQPITWIQRRSGSKSGAQSIYETWEDNIKFSETICGKVQRYEDKHETD